MQIFSKNQVRWNVPPLEDEQIKKFQEECARFNVRHMCIHDSYLINLGSPEPEMLEKSRRAFVHELSRAAQLGIPGVVLHPGAFKDGDEQTCIKTIAESLDWCFENSQDSDAGAWLETTAGMGTSVGHRFEQLARIIDLSRYPERVGVCLDTAHVFAAGYELRTADAYSHTWAEFDRIIGLEKLRVIHLNDSKKACGSRVDRHENIGIGEIGAEAFEQIMNDERLISIPKILETPGGDTFFRKNIKLLKKMVK
jgi:deoxyribonuclease-4